MASPPGTLGNLSAEQEQRLKEFWAITLKTFGIRDPSDIGSAGSARPITPADAPAPVESESAKKKEKHGLFHRKHKDNSSTSSSPGIGSSNDPEDKYGQTRDLQAILAAAKPEDLRASFWSMVKNDHPDTLLLRFLRARKWDVQRALAMLVSTMHWRRTEMHVDDDVMFYGEGGALKDSQSSDPNVKREGADFLQQLRLGKSFLHGVDKEGRPLCFVRVRLHRGGEQSERAMERYTVYVIETCRLALTPPVETATVMFDMTNFTMANMDYTPVKFMIKCFEANYPESLGCILIHKAPWIFQGVWKIIRGWLDPVVAAKVHFTNGLDDLSQYVPKSQIIKELGGTEDWEYKYIEPLVDENARMQDTASKARLQQERQERVVEYEKLTFDWIHGQETKPQRNQVAESLRVNYWNLDPIIRARSLYDRTGMIGPDGKVNYYPTQTLKKENLVLGGSSNGVPPSKEASADDVD
ncbi:phosphatidylinositol transfer protein csr1 [Lithohypha guttulata]|uniref:phosphatidylinositol transfer protein csr1 n=1 Tax=Lithohypha guttulata TaxID=1690604 RepID=UPI002DE0B23A|nr:phosphatidylinositol transfer protein csr1 [Lithohypha guttulata]KAK5102044.1 phosphatidylinositol transfer protein csr1 [Lithohypha guttulata]